MRHSEESVHTQRLNSTARRPVVTVRDAETEEDDTDDDGEGRVGRRSCAVDPQPKAVGGHVSAPKRVSIYLPSSLLQRLRHKCVDADVSLSTAVEQAVERALNGANQRR